MRCIAEISQCPHHPPRSRIEPVTAKPARRVIDLTLDDDEDDEDDGIEFIAHNMVDISLFDDDSDDDVEFLPTPPPSFLMVPIVKPVMRIEHKPVVRTKPKVEFDINNYLKSSESRYLGPIAKDIIEID